MPTPGDNPTLPDVLRAFLASERGSIETALPGRVTAYDHDQQRASVQPLVQGTYEDPDTGERVTYVLPEVHGIPVAFPQAAGYAITWPLSVDDRVLLVFASRDISGWLETDSKTNEPADPRRHDLNDAIAIPGVSSFASPIDSTGRASGAMVIKGGEIRLGSSAASAFVALATLVDSQFTSLSGAFTTWVPVPNDGGAALKALLTTLQGTGWPASTASTKVKAE